MALEFPEPALSYDVLSEYRYTNFPWPEIRAWLLPQIAWASRIVLLDGLKGTMGRIFLEDALFPRGKVVGIWGTTEGHGCPVLADDAAIVAAKPDLILSTLTPASGRFPAMTHLHLLTRACIFPNLIYANPYAGSMMIQASSHGTPIQTLPDVLKESVVRHVSRYIAFSGWAKGKKVLDVACGNGYGSHLLSRVASEVTAVDLNRALIDYGRVHSTAPNLEYVCADVATLKGAKRFDLITSVETFEHIPTSDLDAYVRTLKDLLEPGGILVCTTPLAQATIRNPENREHVAEYSNAEFAGTLSRSFEVLGTVYQDKTGALHAELPPGTPTPQSVDAAHIVQIAVCRAR